MLQYSVNIWTRRHQRMSKYSVIKSWLKSSYIFINYTYYSRHILANVDTMVNYVIVHLFIYFLSRFFRFLYRIIHMGWSIWRNKVLYVCFKSLLQQLYRRRARLLVVSRNSCNWNSASSKTVNLDSGVELHQLSNSGCSWVTIMWTSWTTMKSNNKESKS